MSKGKKRDSAKTETAGGAPSPGLLCMASIYADKAVCRLLGIRRSVVTAVRRKGKRGEHWACVGRLAGLTDAGLALLPVSVGEKKPPPILRDDGLVSVRVKMRPMNGQLLVCERLCDGVVVQVRVRSNLPFRAGEEFEARVEGGLLVFDGEWPERGV